MKGKHIELFLAEGTPGALTTAEISEWTGHVLSGPRSDLANIMKRAEANIMLAGSIVVGLWAATGKSEGTQRSYAALRARFERLIADGSIVVEGAVGRLSRDVAFGSPSTAGAIALGRSCNGRTAWIWPGGTYADWENRGLEG